MSYCFHSLVVDFRIGVQHSSYRLCGSPRLQAPLMQDRLALLISDLQMLTNLIIHLLYKAFIKTVAESLEFSERI